MTAIFRTTLPRQITIQVQRQSIIPVQRPSRIPRQLLTTLATDLIIHPCHRGPIILSCHPTGIPTTEHL
mgnify:CR=1 FL=1